MLHIATQNKLLSGSQKPTCYCPSEKPISLWQSSSRLTQSLKLLEILSLHLTALSLCHPAPSAIWHSIKHLSPIIFLPSKVLSVLYISHFLKLCHFSFRSLWIGLSTTELSEKILRLITEQEHNPSWKGPQEVSSPSSCSNRVQVWGQTR